MTEIVFSQVLGAVLRRRRKNVQMLQSDVAFTMDTGVSGVSRIENGGALSVAHLRAYSIAVESTAANILRDAETVWARLKALEDFSCVETSEYAPGGQWPTGVGPANLRKLVLQMLD